MSSPPDTSLESVVLDMHFYQGGGVDFGLFRALMEFYEPHRTAVARYIDAFNEDGHEDQSWRDAMQYMPGFTLNSAQPPKEWMGETGTAGSRRSGQIVSSAEAEQMHHQMRADLVRAATARVEPVVERRVYEEDDDTSLLDVAAAVMIADTISDAFSDDGGGYDSGGYDDLSGGGGESGGGGSDGDW